MDIFNSISNYFELLGGYSPQSKKENVNPVKKYLILFSFISMIISQLIYMVYEARNMQEYVNCLYVAISVTLLGCEFLSHIWTVDKSFKFMNGFQAIIEQSEYIQSTYTSNGH